MLRIDHTTVQPDELTNYQAAYEIQSQDEKRVYELFQHHHALTIDDLHSRSAMDNKRVDKLLESLVEQDMLDCSLAQDGREYYVRKRS